jgi:hypothetical protein
MIEPAAPPGQAAVDLGTPAALIPARVVALLMRYRDPRLDLSERVARVIESTCERLTDAVGRMPIRASSSARLDSRSRATRPTASSGCSTCGGWLTKGELALT